MSDDDRRRAEVWAISDVDGTIRETILAGRPVDPDLAARVAILDFTDRTELTDLGFVATLPRLESLWLTGTGVGDLAPLAGARSLQRLTLMRTAVADLAPLAHLPGLAELNIDRTAVTDLSPLAGSTALRRLDLGDGPIADLSALGVLPNLAVLDIGSGARLRRLDLAGFPALATLVALCLHDAALWPAEFPAGLRELIIGDAAWPKRRPFPDLPRLITPDWRLVDDGAACSDPFDFWRRVCLAEDDTDAGEADAADPGEADGTAPGGGW